MLAFTKTLEARVLVIRLLTVTETVRREMLAVTKTLDVNVAGDLIVDGYKNLEVENGGGCKN